MDICPGDSLSARSTGFCGGNGKYALAEVNEPGLSVVYYQPTFLIGSATARRYPGRRTHARDS